MTHLRAGLAARPPQPRAKDGYLADRKDLRTSATLGCSETRERFESVNGPESLTPFATIFFGYLFNNSRKYGAVGLRFKFNIPATGP
jgi:hypothetical protein